jgi:hypothetical protein
MARRSRIKCNFKPIRGLGEIRGRFSADFRLLCFCVDLTTDGAEGADKLHSRTTRVQWSFG